MFFKINRSYNAIKLLFIVLYLIGCNSQNWVIQHLCCDFEFGNETCSQTNNGRNIPFFYHNGSPPITPVFIRDQWIQTDNNADNFFVDCTNTERNPTVNCSIVCLTNNTSGDNCRGNDWYCDNFPCKETHPKCHCRAFFGKYKNKVKLVNNGMEIESTLWNCSDSFTTENIYKKKSEEFNMRGRSLFSRYVNSTNNPPQSENVYWDTSSSAIILIFDSSASRIISVTCRTNSIISECSQQTCWLTLSDFCIPSETASFVIYNGNLVTSQFFFLSKYI